MESRNYHASFQDGGQEWPKVYNLSKLDMVLFAGRLTFEPESLCDSYSSCNQPVEVAIQWLSRQVKSLQKEVSPCGVGSDRLVPPTLPLHMQGRAGVVEYEQLEKERQRRLSRWRRGHKKGRSQWGGKNVSSDESAQTSSSSSSSEEDSEPSRKRKRIPNSRYGDDFVCITPTKRAKKV